MIVVGQGPIFAGSIKCNVKPDVELKSISSTFFARIFRKKVCSNPNFNHKKDFCTKNARQSC